ncbi:MAG: response regulator [Planctomycetes bacterium]|nr:response regulator [Planctomycetota bacterium]
MGTVSVLLAEDAIVSRRKVVAVLKNLGCLVVEATNGREAVDLARQAKPDLVILDLYMPQMNGLEALDALRADRQFEKTTIVMLTVEADASIVRDALSRGADDYIRKDSSPTELQKRIDKHIQKIRART